MIPSSRSRDESQRISQADSVGLTHYRMETMRPINFVLLLAIGIVYGWTTTVMSFLARSQAALRVRNLGAGDENRTRVLSLETVRRAP